jgi:hypothetical protein
MRNALLRTAVAFFLGMWTGSAFGEAEPRLAEGYGKVPIAFEPNRGQADEKVRFVAQGRGYRVFLTEEETVIALRRGDRTHLVQMRFEDAKAPAALAGEDKLVSISNYFIGAPSRHITDVPNYAAVRRRALYDGVDIVFYGNQQSLEYDLVLAPGADPAAIRLAFAGPQEVAIDASGDLHLKLHGTELLLRKPDAYQQIGGTRHAVEARYVARGDRFGFEIGAHDKSKPLVIDPVLSYGNHQGGGSFSNAIAVDAAGNAFAAGQVVQTSVSFPIVSAFDGSIGHGDSDAFVQKFNAAGSALIYSTYLGGPKSVDGAVGIAIDSAGNAYVTGFTNGTDFPTSTSSYQKAATGGGSWIAKLGPAGNSLVYSTYLLNASTTGIAVDSAGNAYVTGTANPSFLATSGAFQTVSHSSSTNAFVFKLNTAGSAPVYSTFYGGSGTDKAFGIAIDKNGGAYIGGSTTSANLPTANAYRPNLQGGKDGFVAKINSTGNALAYGTYLGGTMDDYVTAIAVDTKGAAYVTGDTFSLNFPIRNAFQPTKYPDTRFDAAFVTKLSPGGNDIVYSSYLGGFPCTSCGVAFTPLDIGMSIAVDPQGNAYVGGQTQSSAFQQVHGFLPPIADNGDAPWVVKVSAMGGMKLYSVLIGNEQGIGNPRDWVTGLAADGAGNVYGTGNLVGFPAPPGPFQNSGGSVVFKLASNGGATLNLTSSTNPNTVGQPTTLTATATGSLSGQVTFLDRTSVIGSATLSGGVATFSAPLGVGIRGITAVFQAGTTELESPVLYQVTNPVAVCN